MADFVNSRARQQRVGGVEQSENHRIGDWL